jgi:hypothetical protein
MVDTTTPASVRRELERKFEAFPLLKRDRATALYHFCVALELAPVPISDDADLELAKGRHVAETSMRAIPVIFGICHSASATPPFQVNPAVLAEADEFIAFTSRYDQIMYSFELADRGQFNVSYDPLEKQTVFTYASHDESAADTLLRTHERDSKIVDVSAADQAAAMQLHLEARTELNKTIFFTAPDAIGNPFSPAVLAVARKFADVVSRALRWEFPAELPIGNLTFRDVRRFWGALLSISMIHIGAHLLASQGGSQAMPRGSILPVKSREEWTGLIADLSGIGVGAVTEMLWWYTFDEKVSAATAPIQPFFEIAPGHLTVQLSLIPTLSIERNLQKLLSRHPILRKFYEQVKSAKEQIALEHLRGLFPKADFMVKPTIVIKDVTDADLLVYQRSSGFALVIQHKWLIAPETVKESGANDDELRKGAVQAVQSRDVFRNDHALVRRELGLPDDQKIDRVEAVVVCRGAEPTGFLGKQAVPIAVERSFEDLWKQSSGSLSELWNKLSTRPDHVEAASRYGDTALSITLGGLRFSLPMLSVEIK